MTEVKRYDVMACIGTPARTWHSVVLASDYDALAAELAEAKETAHYADGVTSLAMKHRDMAEADRDRLRAALEAWHTFATGALGWDASDWLVKMTEEALRGADQPTEPLKYHRVNVDGSCTDCGPPEEPQATITVDPEKIDLSVWLCRRCGALPRPTITGQMICPNGCGQESVPQPYVQTAEGQK